jgi:hypothetical protein
MHRDTLGILKVLEQTDTGNGNAKALGERKSELTPQGTG